MPKQAKLKFTRYVKPEKTATENWRPTIKSKLANFPLDNKNPHGPVKRTYKYNCVSNVCFKSRIYVIINLYTSSNSSSARVVLFELS